ncbi:MAG TPA: hypothetical protein VGB50_09010 [Flavobacterium sp.]|jgi:mono/diheme cytochrome c family protein
MFLKKITPLVLMSLIAGCTSDSSSDLIEVTPVDNVTYTEHVRTIINNNCIVCHGTIPANGAPMSLTTYENVKDAVQNRGLLDRISRPEGTSGMMPNGGPRLPQHIIDLVFQWNEQGLQQ